jgi:hypothetical protein
MSTVSTKCGFPTSALKQFGEKDHARLPWASQQESTDGTASLGVVGSRCNGFGTTGIAPDCTLFFSGVLFWNNDELVYDYNAPGAIMTAIAALGPGDVLLIELEGSGPVGFCPIEWEKPVYDRIVLAVGLGIVVVEPAGNGNNSLNHPLYSTGNNGHWPFIQAQDSGAIIVGAGAAPANFGGTTTERSRLTFSTYGSRVNVQGWGERVTTTGFGGGAAPGHLLQQRWRHGESALENLRRHSSIHGDSCPGRPMDRHSHYQ